MNDRNASGIIGFVCVIMWLLIFLPGLTINSSPFRQEILEGTVTFQNFTTVLITYTITNVALLCCLAGVVGAATKRITTKSSNEKKATEKPLVNAIFLGFTRGFSVYLLLLAGVYAATPDPFAMPTPEQYVRMAGTLSLMSFTVNYEPDLFQTIVGIASSKNKLPKETTPSEKP
jgi:hypothetical protein